MRRASRLVGIAGGAALAIAVGLLLYVSPTTAASLTNELLAAGASQIPSSPSGQPMPLNEVYGDWRVSCIQQGSAKQCLMSQTRPQKNGGGVLTIDLATPPGDLVSGTAVLPFGLDLDAGVMIQVDDQTTVQSTRFRTCVPAGCLVPVNLDAAMVAQLRTGTVLKFHSLPDNDKDFHSLTDEDKNLVFAFSLQGMGAALDRVRALSR